MRKSILIISLCAFTLSVSSQNTAFKVQSDGNIAIHTDNTALSPISIHGAGNSSYYISCLNTVGRNGMYMKALGMGNTSASYGGLFHGLQNNTAIGVRGLSEYGITCVGVMGNSYSGQKSIGVLGSTANCTAGAAVYGTIYGDMGSALANGDNYAGFFYGNVKVTGNIVATTTMQGTLLGESSSESASGVRNLSLSSPSVIRCLSGLSVTTYKKEFPERPKDMETIYHLDGDTLQIVAPKRDIMDEQYYSKSHYALDADHLEEAFPDLVYVKADGSKVINYVEMVPILVKAIQELKQQVDEQNDNDVKQVRADSWADDEYSATTRVSTPHISTSKLLQNTPNPFTERTEIRFTLSDDAQNASIYIFDMTGKMLRQIPVDPSMQSVTINGYELQAGIYLYTLAVNGQEIDTKRMILSK